MSDGPRDRRLQEPAPAGLVGRIVDAARPELDARARGVRRRTAATLGVLLGVPAAVLAWRLATAPGEPSPVVRADARWLAAQVGLDGALPDAGVAPSSRVGLHGLALLALARGAPQRTDEERAAFARAASWLLERQAVDGALSPADEDHALATLALVEAFRLTCDEDLREGAELALSNLLQRQAWGGTGGVAAAAWSLEALCSAREAGLSCARAAETRARARLVAAAGGPLEREALRLAALAPAVAPRQTGLGEVYLASVALLTVDADVFAAR